MFIHPFTSVSCFCHCAFQLFIYFSALFNLPICSQSADYSTPVLYQLITDTYLSFFFFAFTTLPLTRNFCLINHFSATFSGFPAFPNLFAWVWELLGRVAFCFWGFSIQPTPLFLLASPSVTFRLNLTSLCLHVAPLSVSLLQIKEFALSTASCCKQNNFLEINDS